MGCSILQDSQGEKDKYFFFFLLIILDLIIGIIRSIISDTKIPSNVDAGNGLFLPHPNGIIINYSAKIGENVAIFQQVTIGEWKNGTPKIGDSTSIYAGAKIFGEINIGANCKIGPNCVIKKDIPDYTTAKTTEPVLTFNHSQMIPSS
ncbi:MAG: serine acetyltransferase [Proteobacteria bacterium]|nr:serine acetyltransferase [Pseudomonadota bacterium]